MAYSEPVDGDEPSGSSRALAGSRRAQQVLIGDAQVDWQRTSDEEQILKTPTIAVARSKSTSLPVRKLVFDGVVVPPLKRPRQQGETRSAQDRPEREVIYVSSSEVSDAGPSTLAPPRPVGGNNNVAGYGRDSDDDSEINVTSKGRRARYPIIIDASSESDDEYMPSYPVTATSRHAKKLSKRETPKKKTEAHVQDKGKTQATSVPKRAEVIPESASDSEGDVISVQRPNVALAPPPSPSSTPARVASAAEPEKKEIVEQAERASVVQPAPASSISQRGILELLSTSAPAECRNTSAPQRLSPSPTVLNAHSRQPSSMPSTRSSATLARPDDQCKPAKKVSVKGRRKGKGKKFLKKIEEEESDESESAVSSEGVDEEVYCHHCRVRNAYAKMKCTNVVNGWVCPLSFCHKCVLSRYPSIEFDPFTVMFVCPRCTDTCNCDICCRKRGDVYIKSRFRWQDHKNTLLYSETATHRLQRGENLYSAASRPGTGDRPKHDTRLAKAKLKIDIGQEAEDWIRTQNARLVRNGGKPGRVFIGAWQSTWGPPPQAAVSAMDCVELDVHAASGRGKGKARAVEPDVRLYVGDARGLRRPFLRMNVLPGPARNSPMRKSASAKTRGGVRVGGAEEEKSESGPPPCRKRRRVAQPDARVPEFTMNHQESVAPSVASSLQAHLSTPDDFAVPGLGPELDLRASMRYGPYDAVHGPVLGVVEGDRETDALGGGDAYGFDWGANAVDGDLKTYSYPAYDDAYEDPYYDAYAAALGTAADLESYDAVFGYGYEDPVVVAAAQKRLPLAAGTTIDPALLGGQSSSVSVSVSADHAASCHSHAVSGGGDAATPCMHGARASVYMLDPGIYGAPSSTGLSMEDLERAVRAGLAATASE